MPPRLARARHLPALALLVAGVAGRIGARASDPCQASPLVNTCVNADTFWPHAGPQTFATVGGVDTVDRGALRLRARHRLPVAPHRLSGPAPGVTGTSQLRDRQPGERELPVGHRRHAAARARLRAPGHVRAERERGRADHGEQRRAARHGDARSPLRPRVPDREADAARPARRASGSRLASSLGAERGSRPVRGRRDRRVLAEPRRRLPVGRWFAGSSSARASAPDARCRGRTSAAGGRSRSASATTSSRGRSSSG